MVTETEERDGGAPHGREPHLRDYLRILYTRRWVLISTLALCLLLTLLVVLVQTPIYCPTCQLLLQPTQSRVVDIKQVYDPTFGAEAGGQLRREFLETHYLLILSKPNLEKTFFEMGFDKMPEFRGRDPLTKFGKLFSVKGARNSYIAEVSFQWKDPRLATQTLTFLIEQYTRSCRARALGVTEGGLESLRLKGEELRPKVEAKSVELQEFMAQHNMVSLEQSQDIITDRLKELSRSLTIAETQRIQAESRLAGIKAALAGEQTTIDLPEIMDSQTIRDIKLEYIQRMLQFQDLTDGLGPNHPAVKSARVQMTTISQKLDMEVHSVLRSVEAQVERARAQENELRAALTLQEKEVMEFNKVAAEYRLLKDSHATLSRAHNSVSQRIEEIEIAMAAGSREDGLFVVAPAQEPTQPIKPRKARSMLLAMVVGLLLGIGLCFFLDYLDTSIKTKEEVETLLAAPVLGFVPSFRDGEARPADGAPVNMDLLALEKPRSPIAEAFRSVRTSLSFTRLGSGCQQFAVTSALPSEGKTLVSTNVAIALAQTGKRVLLVDADMRRPRVHKVFRVDATIGLSNLLAGQEGASIEAAVKSTQVPNLSILPSGPIPPNPAELLGSTQMAGLVQRLGERFDCVVYDTPPAVSVTDSAVLARTISGVLLVVRTFTTDRSVVGHARELLDTAGARLIGVILNGVDMPHGGYPYYGYYYYSNSYYGDGEGRKGARRSKAQDKLAS